jgi:hypothetical protein
MWNWVRNEWRRLLVIASVVALGWAAGCSLKEALIGKADEAAGKAVVSAVKEQDPQLAQELGAEATQRTEEGQSWPWMKTLAANWWVVALALGLGGEATRRIRKLLLERKYAQAVMEILSSGIEHFKRDSAGGPDGARLAGHLAAARAAHPDAPAGSLRKAMEKLGASAARTSPA